MPVQRPGHEKAHTSTQLTEVEFNALAEDTTKALNKFKVSAQEQGEVMNMPGSFKGDIADH